MEKPNIAVLLSSYNGEKYIEEQIESVLNQKDVTVHIFVRDDGSKDNTLKILEKYEKNSHITIIKGENLGYAHSFWSLLSIASNYDYYCFCDQDDIWLEDKIISAVKMIQKEDSTEKPLLYTSKVISINNKKEIINENTFSNTRKLNIYESFQKSCFPGCVFVFNKKARDIMLKYSNKNFLESHDWAAYSIVSVFGNTVYDDKSYINYRIHEENAIGKKNKFASVIMKVKRFFEKDKCTRSNFAKDFYETYQSDIPEQYKQSIQELAYYRNSRKLKRQLLLDSNFKGIIFKTYVLLNKV